MLLFCTWLKSSQESHRLPVTASWCCATANAWPNTSIWLTNCGIFTSGEAPVLIKLVALLWIPTWTVGQLHEENYFGFGCIPLMQVYWRNIQSNMHEGYLKGWSHNRMQTTGIRKEIPWFKVITEKGIHYQSWLAKSIQLDEQLSCR